MGNYGPIGLFAGRILGGEAIYFILNYLKLEIEEYETKIDVFLSPGPKHNMAHRDPRKSQKQIEAAEEHRAA